jgi:hypothetical protein
MAETTDKLMAIADGLVAALGEREFSLPFTAEWIDNPIVELADPELRTARVWVVDFAEREETVHGIPLEEFELLLVIQQKLDAKENTAEQCRKLSGLVSELAAFCRNTGIAVNGEEAVCVKIERERARDFKEYHEKLLFRAEVSTHWQKVSDEDE